MFWDNIENIPITRRQRKRIIAQLKIDWHSTKFLDIDKACELIRKLEEINSILEEYGKEEKESS